MSLEPMDPLCVSLVHQYLMSTKSNLVDEYKSKYQPKKTNLTMEEVVTRWKEEQLARGLVYQHMKKVTPALAQEFAKSYHVSSTDDVKEVIEVIEQQQLIGSLVLRHLQQVAPALAPEFGSNQVLLKNVPEDIVQFIGCAKETVHQTKFQKKQTELDETAPKKKHDQENRTGRLGMRLKTFTTEEVALIERAMASGEDLAVLATQLGRSYDSICQKIKYLEKVAAASKTGRFSPEEIKRIYEAIANNEDYRQVAKELKRNPQTVRTKMLKIKCNPNPSQNARFSLEEDFLILDKVVPGMKVNSLSSTGFLSQNVLMDLATEFKRDFQGVSLRWETRLQPWLLQHYTGTSGLRVERMLTALVAQKYKDHKGVDWSKIVKEQKEFAGHTSASIRQIFNNIRTTAMKKKKTRDLNLQEVAEYAADVYQPGKEKMEPPSTTIHREKVIAYFKSRTEDLGIEVAF